MLSRNRLKLLVMMILVICMMSACQTAQYANEPIAAGQQASRLLDDSAKKESIEPAQLNGALTEATNDAFEANQEEMPNKPAFSDDFQDGNANAWDVVSGEWLVEDDGSGNMVYRQSERNGEALTVVGDDWTDVHVTAEIEPVFLQNDGKAGVLFRYADSDNYYLAVVTDDTLQLVKVKDGTTTMIEEVPHTMSVEPFTIEAEARADFLKVYLNKTLLVSFTDNDAIASGKIGLYTSQAEAVFDNIRVSDVIRLGIARSNLFWLPNKSDQYALLDEMKNHGMNRVRLNISQPGQILGVTDLILYANQIDMDVLLSVGLSGNSNFYPPTAQRVVKNTFNNSYRLSELDPALFEQELRKYLNIWKSAGATLYALNIGNEVNWVDFNGDFPEVDGGRVFDHDTDWNDPVFAAIRQGIDKWGQAIQAAKLAADDIFGEGAITIITGGFANIDTDGNWFKSKDASLMTAELTLQLLQGSHPDQTNAPNYLEAADYIGSHLYPFNPLDTDPETGYASMKQFLAKIMDPVIAAIGTEKPFWIDEMGINRNVTEEERLQLFQWFMLALYDSDFPINYWDQIYIYDFDHGSRRIYEDGVLLEPGKIFLEYPNLKIELVDMNI